MRTVPSKPAEQGRGPLPTGTVTFLFTDIEGSTRLLQELGNGYGPILAEHRAILERSIEQHGGRAFGTEGDAVFAAFGDAGSALAAAADGQRDLAQHVWPDGHLLKVRMGIHSGEAALVGADYVGLTLHQVARITAAGHGGQILVSDAARALAASSLPDGVELRDLGEHRLKDLTRPERLFQAVVPGLPASFPSLRTLEGRPNNLPVQPTTFVGREEIDGARRLLASTRLLTLTGPGGTGKTRLALQLAAEELDMFPDGVYFIALDAVADPNLVPSAITVALGVDVGNDPPLDRLVEHLRGRKTLLVLDNFEQIVAAGGAMARILREAPAVKLVVTSRILLRVYGEQELSVPPLGLPPPGQRLAAAEAMESEAVRLFVERALAAQPDFRLDDTNAAAVADIVTRLDGLPLAIELAAARVRILAVETLRARLHERLAVLTGGPRDLPARQQTLRGAIDWSYDLLDEADRRLFERFAVFSGGASISHAESVCGAASDLGREVFDGLASLAEQSLIRPVPGTAEEPRFTMLATIREYASERLEASGAGEEVMRRHALTYLELAETCAPGLTGVHGSMLLDRLAIDHDNLRAAFDWAVDTGDAEISLRLITAAWRFWQIRGHLQEATERVARALAMPGVSELPALLRAEAYAAAGSIAYWRGDQALTHVHYKAGLEAARESGDARAIAGALYNFGFAPKEGSREGSDVYREGRRYWEPSLTAYRELADERGIAGSLWALAIAEGVAGEYDTAREHFEESLRLYRSLEDGFGVGWANHMLGTLYITIGEPQKGEPYLREGLLTFAASRDLSGILLLLLDFAILAGAHADEERQWRLAGAANEIQVSTGTDLVDVPIGEFSWEVPKPPTGDERAERLYRDGQRMSVEDAIAYALGDPSS